MRKRISSKSVSPTPPVTRKKETNHDSVMERVDAEGQVIGFSILGVSKFNRDKPLEADLIAV